MFLEYIALLLVVLTSGLIYGIQQNTIKKLKRDILELKNNSVTIDTKPLDGIFEVHITIDPEGNFVKLMQFIDSHREKSMKIVYAVASEGVNQYMLSYFTRKDDEALVIDAANDVVKDLEDNKMKVLRVKIEGHNVKGTPMTKKDYVLFRENMIKKSNVDSIKYVSNPYFEFHVKVGSGFGGGEYYTQLENDVKNINGVAISYNMCSKDRKPILTMRVYDDGFIGAISFKDDVMNKLKAKGYVFDDKIQQEFSMYDTNGGVDGDWLLWR